MGLAGVSQVKSIDVRALFFALIKIANKLNFVASWTLLKRWTN